LNALQQKINSLYRHSGSGVRDRRQKPPANADSPADGPTGGSHVPRSLHQPHQQNGEFVALLLRQDSLGDGTVQDVPHESDRARVDRGGLRVGEGPSDSVEEGLSIVGEQRQDVVTASGFALRGFRQG
jgi:hypothetical protein